MKDIKTNEYARAIGDRVYDMCLAQMQDRGLWLLWLERSQYSTQTVSGKLWLLIVVY
jgi:hypothetical protein